MQPAATDWVAWCVCLSVGHVCEPCKTFELIEIPFQGLPRVGPKNHVLGEVQITQGPIFGSCLDHSNALFITPSPHPHPWSDFYDLYVKWRLRATAIWGHVDASPHIGNEIPRNPPFWDREGAFSKLTCKIVTCEASRFDSSSSRTSDSGFDSYWRSGSKFSNRLAPSIVLWLVVVKFAFKVEFRS